MHHIKLRDQFGKTFIQHGGIWLFELKKLPAEDVATEEQRWLRFFKEGETLNDQNLPKWMATQEMEKAMKTLMQFSEKEIDYHNYQNRQNYLRQERTIQKEIEVAREEKEAALARERTALTEKNAALSREKTALAEKEAALVAIAHLKALLKTRNQ